MKNLMDPIVLDMFRKYKYLIVTLSRCSVTTPLIVRELDSFCDPYVAVEVVDPTLIRVEYIVPPHYLAYSPTYR